MSKDNGSSTNKNMNSNVLSILFREDFGFENIFSVILAFGDPSIVDFANEAVSCFQCLESCLESATR
ncbi:unnamed protein product [Microthlaspi erraticum]|uniref:Uncharacterized protein n=1 Tax=Microthlaspi erraticum TaxID=1685480 RepID=A0A6D2I7F6_9BRAS|nr:unnamed protein product [Microthlaspi erraticum]